MNPGGANSDHLYHGLVRIPTAKLAGTDVGNSLTRIKNVVGRLLTVTGEGVPTSALVLHLGYEDDNYDDNGYDRHDDGTEDQCKGDNGNDGGPAHVTITICRKRGLWAGHESLRLRCALESGRPQWLPAEPHWSWQDRPGNHGKIPSTSRCHEFSKHDVGRPPSPNFPDCQTNPAWTMWIHQAASIGPSVRSRKRYHSELFHSPGTSTGSRLPLRAMPAGLRTNGRTTTTISRLRATATQKGRFTQMPDAHRKFLHVEFDSDETIDHFTNDSFPPPLREWAELKEYVHNGDVDGAARLFVGHTIMTGMFGLDGEHELKSELHPLYAMATRRDIESTPEDEAWLIFVRNLGDEGFCSSQIWNGGFEDYTFRLPWRDGMTSVEVNWDKTRFEGTMEHPGQWFVGCPLIPDSWCPLRPLAPAKWRVARQLHVGPRRVVQISRLRQLSMLRSSAAMLEFM